MNGELRWRWDTPEGLVLAGEVLGRLRAGQPLAGLGLGEVAGRIDLRGFPAPVPHPVSRADAARGRAGAGSLVKAAELVQILGATLRGLDLSGAVLDRVTFRDCVIEDCVLDGVHGHDLAIARTQVRDTSMRGADLRDSRLGPWRAGVGNEYSRVSFAGADLRVGGITAWFRDCDFSGARLDGARFTGCGLVRCRFSGLLDGVLFNGNKSPDEPAEPNCAQDVDMAQAVFRNVGFRGFDLDAVALPDDPGLWVIRDYPCVIRKAVRALEGREDQKGSFLLVYFTDQLRGIDLGHPVGLLNRNDFVTAGSEELAVLAESVIRQAERECQGPASTTGA